MAFLCLGIASESFGPSHCEPEHAPPPKNSCASHCGTYTARTPACGQGVRSNNQSFSRKIFGLSCELRADYTDSSDYTLTSHKFTISSSSGAFSYFASCSYKGTHHIKESPDPGRSRGYGDCDVTSRRSQTPSWQEIFRTPWGVLAVFTWLWARAPRGGRFSLLARS